ncbi:UDP-N-acetylmuramate dehydrogenase [Bacteroides sp. OttesenSCG-928-D19]|nr:UDP-N-acetylmuramate dehydrogenase [Bacteroides sp. OttesenSCG-928-N06]MDL2304534.1 UDP-N-acetylmuramate dehydrogenase [Bacteroides sp. OttesenSCG-928-D19]
MINESSHYSLLHHNTFGIEVNTSRFIEYDTVEELSRLINDGKITEPYLHIGQGSNLLFTHDYEGVILHSRIKSIEVIRDAADEVLVSVGSGVVWDDFVAYCVENKWYGAENLSNIPGEVGASAVQNIGAYGVEVKDIIYSVSTLNMQGEEKIYTRDECKFSYRYSIFKEPFMRNLFVTSVCFRLSKKESYKLDYGSIKQELDKFPEPSLSAVRRVIIGIRSSKLPDPAVLGNAGSFFMNPIVERCKFEALQAKYPNMPFYDLGDNQIKIPAGWLIEQSGWKGRSLGPAKVHDKQALVLVNTGGAQGKDIVNLADAVRAAVKEFFDIDIKPEVKFV